MEGGGGLMMVARSLFGATLGTIGLVLSPNSPSAGSKAGLGTVSAPPHLCRLSGAWSPLSTQP